MKAFLFSILIFISTVESGAQESPGKFYLSGGAGYSYTSGNSGSSTNLNTEEFSWKLKLSPELGYYLNMNLMLGLKLNFLNGYTRSSISVGLYPSADKFNIYSGELSAALYVKYHLPLTEKLFFTTWLGSGLGYSGKQVTSSADSDSYFNFQYISNGLASFQLFLSPGLQYYITRNFGLNIAFPGIQYIHGKTSTAIVTDFDADEFSINLNPGDMELGLFYRF